MSFKVRLCVCGHAPGDHRGVPSPHSHFPTRGICLRCDCPKYTEVDENGEAA
jgi:hypothetical protein